MPYIVYADGSCKGNPGPGGWGAIVCYEDQVTEIGGAHRYTTNNQMELQAVISALIHISSRSEVDSLVITDSSYVIHGITSWITQWQANGWKGSGGKPVVNKELWQQLDQLVRRRQGKVQWKHVRGHTGVPGNERVDKIADAYATHSGIRLYSGSYGSYGVLL